MPELPNLTQLVSPVQFIILAKKPFHEADCPQNHRGVVRMNTQQRMQSGGLNVNADGLSRA